MDLNVEEVGKDGEEKRRGTTTSNQTEDTWVKSQNLWSMDNDTGTNTPRQILKIITWYDMHIFIYINN